MKYSKLLQFIAIGIIAAIATFLFYRQKVDFLEAVDLKLKDARFKIRKTIQPDNRIVIVAIDSKSVNEIGRWPWKRSVMAELLDSLKEYGVKVSALDIVFSETSDKKDDEILSKSIKKNGNVILGYFFRDEEEKPDTEAISQLQSSKIKLVRIQEGVTSVPISERPFIEANIPLIGQGALDFGFFNTDPDPDGLVRKASLLMLYQGEIYPSLALKALRHYTEKEIMLDIASFGVSTLRLGQMSIPSNESGKLVVNYYGRGGTFTTLSAVDVIKKRIKKNDLENKIVFIGATEVGIYDMRATPVQSAFPGVEIHATVASSVLQERFIIRDTRIIGIEMLCLFLLPVILVLILGFLRNGFLGLMAFILLIFAYAFLNYSLFKTYSIDMSVLYPLSSTAIAFVGAEAYRNLVFEKKNRYLKKAFSSYISPELVSEIIKNPDRLSLGGAKKEVTILFSDIRGFTGISEKLQPDVLVSLLNEYLGPMTKVVLKNNGTLDKYIGDAIMTIYNAPLDVPDHPLKACQTAVEMLSELNIINESFKENGLPNINIGIGINTGYAVVGNMGADMRFDYTAIGDTVNLASRLEGQNKYYGTHIILSEYTAHRVKYKFILRELDLLKVVGKEKPVAIFELMTEQNEKLAEEFSKSLKFYRGKEFKKALASFKKLSTEHNDNVSKMYADRCNEYIKNPPSDSWDGIFISMKK
ncbi:MAG: adenylate/guanylate cyclase domain-containing protein [Nitrospiraceae bacterium]|nr:adenylate/guanylate cyclase domain-containing protein [Nitrospiraceae bacterium]